MTVDKLQKTLLALKLFTVLRQVTEQDHIDGRRKHRKYMREYMEWQSRYNKAHPHNKIGAK